MSGEDEVLVVNNEEDSLLQASGTNDYSSALSIATGDSESEIKSVSENDHQEGDTSRLRGRLTLVFVAFLYGTLNVSLRMLYALPGPPSASVLSTVRGWLAAAAFIPLISQMKAELSAIKIDNEINVKSKRVSLRLAALELAFWNFGAQGLLNVGLLFTDATRAAFFTQTSVVITPLLSLIAGQKVSGSVGVGCIAALAGLVLLSESGGPSDGASTSGAHFSLSLSGGDLIVLAGALSWSMYIFRMSNIGERYPEISLQGVKLVMLACLYSSWFLCSAIRCYFDGGWSIIADLWQGWADWKAWALLAFSAVGPGALADVMQQQGQKEVSASEANVILCGEPVFTTILARVILGEQSSGTETAGGALIIIAALLA
eukprot:CAMPEP_0113535102 /NCGR_PEP_ID=MMETSP0015_2-20120614/5518_1 /TAXON_ID=2838 /ORGANISM="Odontella" /LENGTH=373 /DNA_ID=CAMNT_0000434317 /DNA_START=210 /DNA_END=1328 /DNA_ORIENTATION=- /assembly_acc=CAM_ASM_000160